MSTLKHSALWLALLGMLVPYPQCLAAAPSEISNVAATPQQNVLNVTLSTANAIHGRYVDTHGRPIPGAAISLSRRNHAVTSVITDSAGRFVFQNIKGGSYQLQAGRTALVIRAWTANAAPPMARTQLIIVDDGQTVRGQQLAGCTQGQLLVGALVVAGIAAAIAIPIALANDDDDEPSSP